jgi:hypothetical protein
LHGPRLCMHVTCLREGGVETDLGFWQGSFQIGVGGWHGGVVELAVRRILIVDLAPAGSGWSPWLAAPHKGCKSADEC